MCIHILYIHTCTEGTCTSIIYTVYIYVCVYTHTYIHVLKVRVHLQCLVVYSVMHINVHLHVLTCVYMY